MGTEHGDGFRESVIATATILTDIRDTENEITSMKGTVEALKLRPWQDLDGLERLRVMGLDHYVSERREFIAKLSAILAERGVDSECCICAGTLDWGPYTRICDKHKRVGWYWAPPDRHGNSGGQPTLEHETTPDPDDCLTDSEMDELRYGQEDPAADQMDQDRREEAMEAQR